MLESEDVAELEHSIDWRIWATTVSFLRELSRYFRLYLLLFALGLVGCTLMYVLVEPVYTASATIGPPRPSPASSMLTGLGGGGAAGSITKRLLGSSAGGQSTDPFDEYLAVLYSTRLANELTKKEHLLPVIFASSWDEKTGTWRERGPLHRVMAAIKHFLHRPSTDHPDANYLRDYLSKHLDILGTTSKNLLVASSDSSYLAVSLPAPSPRQAETILNVILSRADEIIRQEQLRDVNARITYLSSELPKISQAEQKDAIIQALSNQESLRMMLVADQRYASTLIDIPHASPTPTWPPSLPVAVTMTMVISGFACAFVVLLAGRCIALRKLISSFRKD